MKKNEEPQGKLLVACAQSIGALIFFTGFIRYWAIDDKLGSFCLMFFGFGAAWFARQCFDFYNFELLKLMRRFKAGRILKKRKKSAKKIANES